MAMEFVNGGSITQRLASVATFTVPTPNASFSFWTRVTSLAANVRRFFGSANNFEARGGNPSGTTPPGRLVNDFYNNTDGAMTTTLITVGPWFHVAGTGQFSGGNSITRIYLNGTFEATATITGSAVSNATMTLGNRTGMGSGEGLNGLLDDIRIYNRLLSDNEIQTIFQTRGTDGIVNGLVLRVIFNESANGLSPTGSGFVKDLSDNKNNYTATGSPVYRESVIRSRRRLC